MTALVPPLVGRDHESELLERTLADVCAGAARFVFATGEPGIGKTSLLLQLIDRARDRDCLVLRGGGAEFEHERPFGLLVDAFDEYLASLDPRAFNRLAAENLAELAGVFGALRSLDPGSEHPTSAAERFRAHHAVRELIEYLAVAQPLVLMLDDLHWADGASLELVSYLLRHPPHGPVLVACSFRDGQVAGSLTGAIERAGADAPELVERLALGPLGRGEAEALMGDVGAAERDRLYELTGGNPFYLLQLARGAEAPEGIAAAIAGELAAISPRGRRLIEAAAVAGDPFDLDLAVATAGLEEPAALATLDELILHDLIRPADVPRRFHFRHPLVRRAVYEGCPLGTRLAAHERSAAALAAWGAPATARAHHVEHAARQGDAAAAALLREAAAATLHRAPGSAARWFGIALAVLPADAPGEERVELLTALATAYAATGRFEDSRDALLESLALIPDADDPRRADLAGACAGLEQQLGHHEAARRRLLEALDQLSDPTSAQAVALTLQLAVGDFYRMDYAAMRDRGSQARAAAGALSDPPLTAAATAVMASATAFLGIVAEATVHCQEAATLVDALSDGELACRVDALANLATAELYLHRYEAAGAHARRGLAIARSTGQGELSPVLVPVLSHVLHRTGEVAESAALIDEALEAARLTGNAEALGWNLLSRAFTAVVIGDLDTALAAAQESVDITRGLDDGLVSTYAGVALATALVEAREPARAIEALLSAAGGAELPRIAGGWRPEYFELLTRCELATGQLDQARVAADRAAVSAAALGLPLSRAMALRAAASVALAEGEAASAATSALAAAAAADEAGAPVEAARTRTLAGRALAESGDPERAAIELERAVHQFERCGAARYRAEAERELRELGHRVYRRTRPGKSDGVGLETLTERETEVAQLVVDRRTNPEIASELYLSVKTIETHLRSIFRKLDVSSRYDVAREIERVDHQRSPARQSHSSSPVTSRSPST